MPSRKTPAAESGLSHVDAEGRVRMVDVGGKPETDRRAVARGRVTASAAALRSIRQRRTPKGDPLQAARLAGIMGAKRTSDLVPLCHPLPISQVEVDLRLTRTTIEIEASVRTSARTGVEMEALTAVSVAALTLYDMLKAVDQTMVIGDVRLVSKTGGRSGPYRRAGEAGARRR